MKKLLIAGGAVVGAAVVARRCASRCGGIDFERMIERMPENAPPKWMFRNITAIRDNTDRILQLLEQEHTPAQRPRPHSILTQGSGSGAPRGQSRAPGAYRGAGACQNVA